MLGIIKACKTNPPQPTQPEVSFPTPVGAGVLTRPRPLSRKPPPRRRKYQRTRSGIPPTQRQWRKRNHGSLKRRPPRIERHPKVFHPRNNISASALYPVVPHHPKISTGLPFLFRSPEPLFLLQAKEKVVLAPAGQAKTNKTEKGSLFAEGKSGFVKFHCRADKISAPTKVRWLAEKRLPARGMSHPQGDEPANGRTVTPAGQAKNIHSRLILPAPSASSLPAPGTTPPSLLQQGPAS